MPLQGEGGVIKIGTDPQKTGQLGGMLQILPLSPPVQRTVALLYTHAPMRVAFLMYSCIAPPRGQKMDAHFQDTAQNIGRIPRVDFY
ncbi:hypothetical protein XELAEV_18028124mg [Xenopus laevis]|uniref:Uncharacterized protein n=1 Tax=Xenopus laevis TaxID=8355 RepID=A0A974CYU7_XENLA|nr:hypothetical protein XELAEV_18028124mg [Xenopus laevis]